MQNGAKARGSYRSLPKILEPKSFGKEYLNDVEHFSVGEEFRFRE